MFTRSARIFEVPETIIAVRFDVAESFGHGAGHDTWVMHPVVHASVSAP